MKRAYLLLDESYSKSWKKDYKELVAKTLSFTLTFFLQKKKLYNYGLMLSIKGSNNSAIQKINKKYRGQDKATNVLSFENPNWKTSLTSEQLTEEKNSFYLLEDKSFSKITSLPPSIKILDLGNIILSLEKIEEESHEKKKSFLPYLAFITVHGLLHLLGFDHEEDEEALVMAKTENKIMKKISSNFFIDKL